MIKLQDFARQHGVTDRAVQKHLKKYEKELEGMFERKGSSGTWLSEDACDFLKSKMKTNPIVVDNENQGKIKELEQRIRELEERIERKDVLIETLQNRVDNQTLRIEELNQKQLELNQKQLELKSRGLLARVFRKGE